MKQITQTPGGRRYVGNDFLAMQDLTLKLTEGFYSQFGNFVLYGCEMTGNNIAAGIVMIDGKACIFAGATGITTPYYVQQVVVNENVPYKIGEGLGYQTYTAQACAANEPGAFRLDNAKRFKKLMEPAGVLFDRSKPTQALLMSSNFAGTGSSLYIRRNLIGTVEIFGKLYVPVNYTFGSAVAVIPDDFDIASAEFGVAIASVNTPYAFTLANKSNDIRTLYSYGVMQGGGDIELSVNVTITNI
jgi:hypothetical protein